MNKDVSRAVIVEDIPQMRDLIRIVLSSFGAKDIVEAQNGAEAIAALKSNDVDIVIMDWKMDVMDGLECTRHIREGIDGINQKLPIVLLTGMLGKDSEDAAYAAGVDLYLEKPFSLKTLHSGISKVLNRTPPV
jgi:two-component system chemotaxis response regulator CheY/two-component system phosphate regulon response regulator PhoB